MVSDFKENVIEWFNGDNEIACTLHQRKYITKIRKMMDKQPKLVSKFKENPDGSIFCRIPLKALKLYLKKPNDEGVGVDDETEDSDI